MPTYEHICEACNYEWEDFYSIKAEIPKECPECKKEGQVKRLISGGSGRGIVELTGNELKEHLTAEGNKLKQEYKTNEKARANMEGEASYHKRQLAIDKLSKL